MKVSRFLVAALTTTLMTLLYVHQQSEIYRMGYLIEKEQSMFQELLDKNAQLRYNVQRNASLIRFSDKLSKRGDFQMPDTYRFVKVANTMIRPVVKPPERQTLLSRIFTVTRQAQAQTISRER